MARAENDLFYLGVGAAHSSVSDITAAFSAPELKNSSVKGYAGVRPLKWLAAEVDYVDLGSGQRTFDTSLGNGYTDAKGYTWGVYAVGFLPLPLPVVDVFGKAGVAFSRLDFQVYSPGLGTGFSRNGTGFAWGAGVQAHIKMVGARLEYEDFTIPNTSGAKVTSLSVFLTF